MATRNKASSIHKIVIHSSRIGSQNIDKISLMRIPDVQSCTSQEANKYNNGACNKIKKAVNRKSLRAKYRNLLNFGSCEEIHYSAVNNGKDIDEAGEQNTRTIIRGHTPLRIKKKVNKLSTISKPHPIKGLKMEACNSKTGKKIEKDNIQGFVSADENESVPLKEMKNHAQKKKMESKKKNQGKELKKKFSKQSREDIQSLIVKTEIEDNEIKPPFEETENDKSKSKVTVSKLKRSSRLPITPRKDYNAILGKETKNSNQNISSKVKKEIFNESQTKEENLVSNVHQKNMGTYDKESTVNDGGSKEIKSSNNSIIRSYELQKVPFEKRESMVVLKANNNKAGKKRKENKMKSECGTVLRGSNRISLLTAVTVTTGKGLLGDSKEANRDSKETKYSDHSAIGSHELQKVKTEFIKSEATLKREKANNSRSSTISLTTVPVVQHVSLRYKDPSGDLHGRDDNFESNSKSQILQKKKVTCQKRKSMVVSEANNSNAGNKRKGNKMKNEDSIVLRRSDRLLLLPGVCYR